MRTHGKELVGKDVPHPNQTQCRDSSEQVGVGGMALLRDDSQRPGCSQPPTLTEDPGQHPEEARGAPSQQTQREGVRTRTGGHAGAGHHRPAALPMGNHSLTGQRLTFGAGHCGWAARNPTRGSPKSRVQTRPEPTPVAPLQAEGDPGPRDRQVGKSAPERWAGLQRTCGSRRVHQGTPSCGQSVRQGWTDARKQGRRRIPKAGGGPRAARLVRAASGGHGNTAGTEPLGGPGTRGSRPDTQTASGTRGKKSPQRSTEKPRVSGPGHRPPRGSPDRRP